MSDTKPKLIFMVTHGPESPELATIPFSLANAALASDIEVLMGFQAEGARLVSKGIADNVSAPGFPPLKELVQAFQEGGGRMYVCSPCAAARNITQANLIDGVTIAGGAAFVAEFASATNVVVY